MPLNLSVPSEFDDLKPRIMVVGVGGAGGNAVNNMIKANLLGCEFFACNTDAQALGNNLADRRVQLGRDATRGLGAGSRPDVGRQAAEEVMEEILQHLQGCQMVFVTAGMGGGTGTGAAPVIARAAREQGILTVGVVTKPFQFEGPNRMRLAESGIEELQKFVDTLLIIPNQNLFRIANERTTVLEAFKMADDVLHAGVRGITDLIVMPGLINLDFADIRAVMSEMGKAMMGTGEATGDKRALDAAEAAISNPLLDDVSMKGAKGVLINITGGQDMTLFEIDEAANRIREEIDPDANIIFGSTFDERLDGRIRISVVATGIDAHVSAAQRNAMFTQKRVTPNLTVIEAAPPVPQVAHGMPSQPATGHSDREEAPALAALIATRAGDDIDEPAIEIPKIAAEIHNGAFIPPLAAKAGQPYPSGASYVNAAGSQAESDRYPSLRPGAALAPGGEPAKAKPHFLTRLLGAGRSQPQARPAQGPGPSLNLPGGAPQPRPDLSTSVPSPAQPHLGQPNFAAAQHPAQPQGQPQSEEEYLDIPAFLRRQAN